MAAKMLSKSCCRLRTVRTLRNVLSRDYTDTSDPWRGSVKEGEVNIDLERPMTISTGKMARFADGAAVIQCGDTTVLATAVGKKTATFPLTVEYRQKAAAAGRIPTNYLRRELGSSEHEVLTGRKIDRSLRPLFPPGTPIDTQVICNLLAVDGVNNPDVLAINAASAALAVSNIPWNGPVAAVRVGKVNGHFVINPTRSEQQNSSLNLIVSALKSGHVVMVELSAELLPDLEIYEAIECGVLAVHNITKGITRLQQMCGKQKILLPPRPPEQEEALKQLRSTSSDRIKGILSNKSHHKLSRDTALQKVRMEQIEALKESFPTVEIPVLHNMFTDIVKEEVETQILQSNIRCDGRQLTDLRNITCSADVYKPLHGSALFQRGQTQVFCSVTLDSLDTKTKVDAVSIVTGGLKEKNFMLHYEFPPYATNEVGKTMAGRREIGHGNLAEIGLRPVLPESFPFTIRLTSEVLESNGSSSMASVCGGSLALMDAGVPISSPVAGVAMGLIKGIKPGQQHKDYTILTDILGFEDFYGEMDFKVAGTTDKITALQMDVKLPGIPKLLIKKAILQANAARREILDIMNNVIEVPRSQRKETGPVTKTLIVPSSKRMKLIGPGGIHLKKITSETGIQISTVDDTTLEVFAPNPDAMEEGLSMMEKYLEKTKEVPLEFGRIYQCKIVEIRKNGVMIQFQPDTDTVLLPNSQLDHRRVDHAEVLGFDEGQMISVKYYGKDPVSGAVRISRKALQPLGPTITKRLHPEPVQVEDS